MLHDLVSPLEGTLIGVVDHTQRRHRAPKSVKVRATMQPPLSRRITLRRLAVHT
tara:strand:+ start:312 stop:473 length:162 start_codon:yes stop_codon:yes gene_type:complete